MEVHQYSNKALFHGEANKSLGRIVIEALDDGTPEGAAVARRLTERMCEIFPGHPTHIEKGRERGPQIVASIKVTVYPPPDQEPGPV